MGSKMYTAIECNECGAEGIGAESARTSTRVQEGTDWYVEGITTALCPECISSWNESELFRFTDQAFTYWFADKDGISHALTSSAYAGMSHSRAERVASELDTIQALVEVYESS